MNECDCLLVAQIASRFCHDQPETSELDDEEFWHSQCLDAENMINNLYKQEPETCECCELSVCEFAASHDDNKLWFKETVCKQLNVGEVDGVLNPTSITAACSAVHHYNWHENNDHGRRRLGCGREYMVGCFDEDVEVTMQSGAQKKIKDLRAGAMIQTCEKNVFTTVLAVANHHGSAKMLNIEFESGHHLTVTPKHMVLAQGKLVTADSVNPGQTIDGHKIVQVSVTSGHAMNVVSFRNDIMVNGICGTWLTQEFMPVSYFQFVWDRMNPMAEYFPKPVFRLTQSICDVFIRLFDDGLIGNSILTISMIVLGFSLTAATISITFGTALAFHQIWKKNNLF
jgi:hypothetical protein